MTDNGNSNIKARDEVWEEVLELLSGNGRLNRFFKLPKHEKRAIAQLYGAQASLTLGKVFSLTQQDRREERDVMLAGYGEFQLFALISVMLESMRCWSETDGIIRQKAPSRWKVAHA